MGHQEDMHMIKAKVYDEDGNDDICPDGGHVSVPCMMMDNSMARRAFGDGGGESTSESLLRQGYVLDGLGRLAGHRPGHAYGFVPPKLAAEIEDSRERYRNQLSEAWRSPQTVFQFDDEEDVDNEGAPRFKRGRSQMRVARNEWRARTGGEAYAAYRQRIANAWRNR
jgi:hypothetical protein